MSGNQSPWNLAAAPGFWMYETSGALRPVVEAFLKGQALTAEQVGVMRAYLTQWVDSPVWCSDETLAELRASVRTLTTSLQIRMWLDRAVDIGIDPL